MTTALYAMADFPAVADTGPYTVIGNAKNIVPEARIPRMFRGPKYGQTQEMRTPSSGIGYIDAAVGGKSEPLTDAMAGPTGGFVSFRQKHQRFNGARIAAAQAVKTVVRGPVGAQSVSTGQRARAAQSTELPAQSRVIAAFTSPAMQKFLALRERA